jgi:protease-4
VVREGALLLDLDGSVVEEVSPIDPLNALLSSAVPTREYAARDLVRAIDAAGQGQAHQGHRARPLDLPRRRSVHMTEISEALDRFRATNKPVLAYAVAYSDDSILLASHASEVWVDPMGGAAITGPGGEQMFYAGLLERLGVTAHVFRVGTYKSAVEPYLLNEMSPAARENYTQLYGSLWQEWQANVHRARPTANVARPRARSPTGWQRRTATWRRRPSRPASPTKSARKSNGASGSPSSSATTSGTMRRRLRPHRARPVAGRDRPEEPGGKIGVVTIAARSATARPDPARPGPSDRRAARRRARRRSQGAGGAGRFAGRNGDRLRGDPPRDPAPQGQGHSDRGLDGQSRGERRLLGLDPRRRIFAEPETVTGSIGIFGVLPTFEVGLAKWGVTTDGVRTTPLSGQPTCSPASRPRPRRSSRRPSSPATSASSGWSRSRAGSPAIAPDEIGQGACGTAGTARQLGLVDQFGGSTTRSPYAAKQAKLGDGQWHAEFLGADADPYAPILRPAVAHRRRRDAGRDMFALFARRESAQAARVLAGPRRSAFGARGAGALPRMSAIERGTASNDNRHSRGSLLQFVSASWAIDSACQGRARVAKARPCRTAAGA